MLLPGKDKYHFLYIPLVKASNVAPPTSRGLRSAILPHVWKINAQNTGAQH